MAADGKPAVNRLSLAASAPERITNFPSYGEEGRLSFVCILCFVIIPSLQSIDITPLLKKASLQDILFHKKIDLLVHLNLCDVNENYSLVLDTSNLLSNENHFDYDH